MRRSSTNTILMIVAPIALFAQSGCKHRDARGVRTDVGRPTPLISSTTPRQEQEEKPVGFSNMYIHEETGDILGWDLQILKKPDGYDLVLFCGEGEPQGPVRGHLKSLDAIQTLVPKTDVCGSPLKFEFVARGVYLTPGVGERELIPRHINFIKKERYK